MLERLLRLVYKKKRLLRQFLKFSMHKLLIHVTYYIGTGSYRHSGRHNQILTID